MKASGSFDKDAQLEALTKAKDIALLQMTKDVQDYITKNYGDIDNWLTTQIEATIKLLRISKIIPLGLYGLVGFFAFIKGVSDLPN